MRAFRRWEKVGWASTQKQLSVSIVGTGCFLIATYRWWHYLAGRGRSCGENGRICGHWRRQSTCHAEREHFCKINAIKTLLFFMWPTRTIRIWSEGLNSLWEVTVWVASTRQNSILTSLRQSLKIEFVRISFSLHLKNSFPYHSSSFAHFGHDVLVIVVTESSAQFIIVHVWLTAI